MSKRLRRKRKNSNISRKGFNIKVEPTRRLEDIQLIRRMLKHKPRDQMLITLGNQYESSG